MPSSTRRQAQERASDQRLGDTQTDTAVVERSSQVMEGDIPADQEMEDDEQDGEEEEEDENEEEAEAPIEPNPPPGLKDISALASWTVSTAKPGNGVAALRSPDTSLFWQSDGPQPHLLSIHFFKLVPIAHMRIYLDFNSDESYTPTKVQFLAGMSEHDLQEFAEMSFERPVGWIDVDFSNVGPLPADDDVVDNEDGDEDEESRMIAWSKRPILRAFLVQVKILENHQNGKDTHLRAVQLFARDDSLDISEKKLVEALAKAPAIPQISHAKTRPSKPNNIQLASWMEPELR